MVVGVCFVTFVGRRSESRFRLPRPFKRESVDRFLKPMITDAQHLI